MYIRPIIALIGSLCVWGSLALAQDTRLPDYQAQSLQTAPDQPDRVGFIYKSGSQLRLEFTQDGLQIIQVLRPTQGRAYVLFPEKQSYLEQQGPAQPEEFINSYTPPCPAEVEEGGLQCNRLGLEVYQNIPVERWHIGAEDNSGQMIILWDPSRKRALWQESSNGIIVKMTFLGIGTVSEREAEHWVTEVSRPSEATLRNEWWYDSELKLVLRETFADGTQRIIDNITVGPVDPNLFTVPDGWQRLNAPATTQ